jgi:hypothetical protein
VISGSVSLQNTLKSNRSKLEPSGGSLFGATSRPKLADLGVRRSSFTSRCTSFGPLRRWPTSTGYRGVR